MKIWLLNRVLGTADHKTRVLVPIMMFEDHGAAQEASALHTEALQRLLQCRVVDPEHGDTGLTLSAAVAEIGITGFQHVVDGYEVESRIVPPPKPSIILP